MSVRATITVPPTAFRLGDTLAQHPSLQVELERVVPFQEAHCPYLRLRTDSGTAVLESVRDDPDVASIVVLERGDGLVLAGVEWTEPESALERSLVDADATCLDAVGTADHWRVSLRFVAHEALTDCYRQLTDEDIGVTVDSVHGTSAAGSGESGVTTPQRETLLAALELGYFAVPREVTLQELAEQLGISDTATSQRLRRGLSALVAEQLT